MHWKIYWEKKYDKKSNIKFQASNSYFLLLKKSQKKAIPSLIFVQCNYDDFPGSTDNIWQIQTQTQPATAVETQTRIKNAQRALAKANANGPMYDVRCLPGAMADLS